MDAPSTARPTTATQRSWRRGAYKSPGNARKIGSTTSRPPALRDVPRPPKTTGVTIELSNLIDALPGLVWAARPDGYVDFISQRWCDYTGLSHEAAEGFGWQAAVHPVDQPALLDYWRSLLEAGRAGEFEARLRRHDGEFRRFLFSAAPIRDAAGRIGRWCGINTDIEDRSRAEQAQLVRQIIEAQRLSQTGSFTADIWVDQHTWSDELYRIFEIDPSVRISVDLIREMIHPDDREAFSESFAQAVAERRTYDHAFRIATKSGEIKYLHTVARFAGEIAGRPLYMGAIRDVTERRVAEAAVRAREAALHHANSLLNEAQRLSKTGSFTWDLPADEHNWSEELYRIFELDAGTTISMAAIQAAIHPDDRAHVGSVIGRASEGGDFDTQFRIVTTSGAVKHLHVVAHRIDAIADRLVFIGALMDVSEQQLAEAALRASEAELRRTNRLLTDAEHVSRTGSFVVDLEDGSAFWSEELHRIYGIDPDARVTIDLVVALTHPDDQPLIHDGLARAIAGDELVDMSYRIVTPQGDLKHLHAIARRNDQAPGRSVFAGAVQDVTESKLAEEALYQARAELAHVARAAALSTLTASIAHEVNQPLAGIITNASTCLRMLGAEPPDLDGARATAQRTIRDGNRASAIIGRLRGMFARKQPSHEAVALNDAVNEVLALTAGQLRRGRVVVQTALAEDLPRITGDRVQLQQVIMNLVLNAADAMSEVDDRPRTISISTSSDGAGEVILSVRDVGVGIEAAAIERLFDPFYTTKAQGMGIGLSISRSIIREHQGRLWAHNNDGAGATFAFSLPSSPEFLSHDETSPDDPGKAIPPSLPTPRGG